MGFFIPKNYSSELDLLKTQDLIKEIKDFFQNALAKKLNLHRVSAPMFVRNNTGLNDNLSGVETPVNFFINDDDEKANIEIVHSLAKWKRFALGKYQIDTHAGLYTDMNAIRSFEDMDNTHSIYVDQWDWEKIITSDDINTEYLQKTVREIYEVFLALDAYLLVHVPNYKRLLSPEITFITTQELEDLYPNLTPEAREDAIVRKHGSVFVMQIGDELKSGIKHGSRSPDYDDWTLNGDIIIYNPILDAPLELSSMGIRVTAEKLIEQLTKTDNLDRLTQKYHSMLMDGKLPQTIGGGIGQSRICMLFLQKAHIGEVQSSIWPQSHVEACEKAGIKLL